MPSFLAPLFEFLNSNPIGNIKLIVFGYIALLWISIIIWVTRDVLARSNNIFFQALVILINVALPIVGVLLYLIIRPSRTQMERYYEQLEAGILESEEKEIETSSLSCDKCLTGVETDYVFCPNCAFQLKKVCTSCKKPFPEHLKLCPYCGKEPKLKAVPRSSKKTVTKQTTIEVDDALEFTRIDLSNDK